jgi:hypothetical protein
MNTAARTIASLPRSAHIMTTLANLHWLWAPERIAFKLAVLAFKRLNNTAVATFATSSTVSPTYLVDSSSGPPQPCSLMYLQLILPLLGTVRSMLWLPDCGTVYLPTLMPLKRFFSFAVDSSRICLIYRFLRVSHAYSLSSVFCTHRLSLALMLTLTLLSFYNLYEVRHLKLHDYFNVNFRRPKPNNCFSQLVFSVS